MTITEERLAAALRTDAVRFTGSPDLTGTVVRGRRIRRRRVTLSGVAAVLVVTAIATTVRSATTVEEPAGSAPSPFHEIAAGPLGGRVASSMVSLGSDVFIWGGQATPENPAARQLPTDGAIYSAASNSWRRISASPLPGRVGAPVVVTQAGVLVLGGSSGGDPLRADRVDGALYDPVGDTWTKIPDAPCACTTRWHRGRWSTRRAPPAPPTRPPPSPSSTR